MKISNYAYLKLGRLPQINRYTYPPFRANIIFALYGAFADKKSFTDLNKKSQDNLILDIERSIYNHTCDVINTNDTIQIFEDESFTYIYSDIGYKILSNLERLDNDSTFVQSIINKNYNIRDIASIEYDVIDAKGYTDIKNMVNTRKCIKIDNKVSTRYRCANCKEKRTSVIEYQARSSDEPTTLSITCVNCGKNWRIN